MLLLPDLNFVTIGFGFFFFVLLSLQSLSLTNGPLLLSVYANSLTILDDFISCLVDVGNTTIAIIDELLTEDLGLPKLDFILIPEIDGGLIVLLFLF